MSSVITRVCSKKLSLWFQVHHLRIKYVPYVKDIGISIMFNLLFPNFRLASKVVGIKANEISNPGSRTRKFVSPFKIAHDGK